MSLLLVVLNAVAFLLFFIFYQRKKKSIDVGSLFYFIYAASACGSVWYYTQDNIELYYSNITLLPFIYLWISIGISLYPFQRLDSNCVKRLDDNGIKPLLNGLSIAFAILSIPPLLSILSKFSLSMLIGNNLGMMYEADIDKSSLFFGSGLSKICFALIRRFENLIIILLFYQLSQKTKNKGIISGLLLSVSLFFIFKLASGSRGGIMGTFIAFFSMFIFLKNTFSAKLYRMMKMIGLVACSVIFVGVAVISISRFSYSVSVVSSEASLDRWISQYLGEGMVRFNNTIWHLTEKMWGDQNFIFLKSLLGFDVIENYDSFMRYYELKMTTPVNVFYTFIGDFFLDYGFIGALILAYLFNFVLRKAIYAKSKFSSVTVPQLMLAMICFRFLGFGWAANVYRTMFIQKDTFFELILVIILYMIQLTERQKNNSHLFTH